MPLPIPQGHLKLVGGPEDGMTIPFCPWQRVYWANQGSPDAARYVRHTLRSYATGVSYHFFATDRLSTREAFLLLFVGYTGSA
jgi:hypothetical protein